jgi:CRP-like cAMP-binding protein
MRPTTEACITPHYSGSIAPNPAVTMRAMAGYDRSLYQTYLSQVPMFAKCSPEQLDRVAELGDAVTFAENETVVQEGQGGDTFFILTAGKARVTRGEREVASLGAGDYFGELALFDPAPRNATVSAVSRISAIALSRESFTTALGEIPDLREALLHGMAHRIHELDARV